MTLLFCFPRESELFSQPTDGGRRFFSSASSLTSVPPVTTKRFENVFFWDVKVFKRRRRQICNVWPQPPRGPVHPKFRLQLHPVCPHYQRRCTLLHLEGRNIAVRSIMLSPAVSVWKPDQGISLQCHDPIIEVRSNQTEILQYLNFDVHYTLEPSPPTLHNASNFTVKHLSTVIIRHLPHWFLQFTTVKQVFSIGNHYGG